MVGVWRPFGLHALICRNMIPCVMMNPRKCGHKKDVPSTKDLRTNEKRDYPFCFALCLEERKKKILMREPEFLLLFGAK